MVSGGWLLRILIHVRQFHPSYKKNVAHDFVTYGKFRKWPRGRFFTYAQGFRVKAVYTAASPANNNT